MTDDDINELSHKAACDLLAALEERNAEGDDVMLAVEYLAAYVLGSLVIPGHDREMLEDFHGGTAIALAQYRRQTVAFSSGARH